MMGGGMDRYNGGQCVSCGYRAPVQTRNDGSFTITFASPNSAIVQLPGGRAVTIQPMPW